VTQSSGIGDNRDRAPAKKGDKSALSMAGGRLHAGAALLLLALVVATYANSLDGKFLGDSGAVVLEDPRVREVSRGNLSLIFQQQYWYPTADSGVYRPLVTLSFLLNYAVLGSAGRPAGYHWVNLGLHCGNVILAWLLALTIWKRPLPAFFTAAIFATHPVNVESVTNIAGRADLMAGMGVLAGLVLHTRLPDVPGWPRRLPYLPGMLLAALFGLFSKENAVVLPAAMLLYDLVFPLRRPVPWRSLLSGYLAVGAALLTTFWVRHWVFSKLPPFEQPFVDNPLVGADFLTARLTALKVLLKYVWLLIWPQSLAWDYSYNQIPLAAWGAGLLALAGVTAMLTLAAWLYRRNPPACFFGAFFFLALLPTSNLVLVIGSIMAERFLYLPSIGFAGCLAAGILALCQRLAAEDARRVRLAGAVLGAIVIGFSLRSWVRNSDWTDGERFWRSALETCPNSFKTHLAPIYLWSQQGFTLQNIDSAIGEGEQAVAIVSGLPVERNTSIPLATLGTLYRIKGDVLVYKRPEEVPNWYQKSLETLTLALPLDQAYSQEQRRRALAQGWPPDRIAVKGNAYLYQNLGDTYRRMGRFKEALEAFAHLMTLTPLNSAVYSQISEVQTALGKPESAIVALWQAFALGKSAETERSLIFAYRESSTDGCAETTPKSSKLNIDCPLVKTHICWAYEGLVRVLEETGRPVEAEPYRQTALHTYGCALR
jgi:tetratricopeptide (TPR) repeat protein